VFVGLDCVAVGIVNANHSIMWPAAELPS